MVEDQPVSKVVWRPWVELHANDYNPNRVAPVEMRLLKTSIMEDGWTQPIVVRSDGEIVDGFHRWTLASTDPDVQALTDGLVPTVELSPSTDAAHQQMSTIRHNRARGSHYVVRMADIVTNLLESGLSEEEICSRLGMDDEEVERLADRGVMVKRGGTDALGTAWKPAYADEVADQEP